jgi:hypothetical protein
MAAPLDSLNPDFGDILGLFAEGDVEFLLVGAYALALHGAPRATGDIDLLVRPSPENARRVHAQLARFGAPLRAQGVEAEEFARPGLVYQIGLPPRRIDILTEITGLSFDEAWASRETVLLDGRAVPYIGREALIRNKRAAGREKDLADAAALERQRP